MMKQLTLTVIAFTMAVLVNAQDPRLWIDQTIYLDYPILAKGDASLRPLFDSDQNLWKAQSMEGLSIDIEGVTAGQSLTFPKSGHVVYIPTNEDGVFNVKGFFNLVGKYLTSEHHGIGWATPYGTLARGVKLEPGDHVINAWDADKLYYHGDWNIPEITSTECLCAYSKKKGDYIEFTFKATSVQIISEKVDTHGRASFWLDRQKVKEVDTWSENTVNPFVPFDTAGLSNDWHTLRIQVEEEGKYFVLHNVKIENENMPTTTANNPVKAYNIKRNGYWVITVDNQEFKRSTDVINASEYAIEAKQLHPGSLVNIMPPEFTVE